MLSVEEYQANAEAAHAAAGRATPEIAKALRRIARHWEMLAAERQTIASRDANAPIIAGTDDSVREKTRIDGETATIRTSDKVI